MQLVAPPTRRFGSAVRLNLRALIHALVFSSVWIAACVGGLTAGATALLGLPFDSSAGLLLFASTLFVYGLDHWLDARSGGVADPAVRRVMLHPLTFALLVGSAVVTAVLVWRAPMVERLVFGAYASSGVLYGLRCLPVRREGRLTWIRLKDVPYTKGLVVSAAITTGSVGIPLARAAAPVAPSLLVITASLVFLLVAVNTHLFDTPDLEDDRRMGVRTVASLLGMSGLRSAAAVAALLGGLLAALVPSANIAPAVAFAAALGGSAVFAYCAGPTTPRMVYGTLLEMMMALPFLLLCTIAPLSP